VPSKEAEIAEIVSQERHNFPLRICRPGARPDSVYRPEARTRGRPLDRTQLGKQRSAAQEPRAEAQSDFSNIRGRTGCPQAATGVRKAVLETSAGAARVPLGEESPAPRARSLAGSVIVADGRLRCAIAALRVALCIDEGGCPRSFFIFLVRGQMRRSSPPAARTRT